MSTRFRENVLLLAGNLGDHRGMAILGEGNVSCILDDQFFLVKASGTSLPQLKPEHLVKTRFRLLLDAISSDAAFEDDAITALLLRSRAESDSLKPSVEALFHAWLLRLPGVNFVGHCHPVGVNQILCSSRAADFAHKRLYPDQVVCCGSDSVLIPYVDPGLPLARTLAREVQRFIDHYNRRPATILLENHGIIAIGEKHTDVISAIAMAEKAALIFVGAAVLGGPVFMPREEVERIDQRPDEHYRQKVIQGGL